MNRFNGKALYQPKGKAAEYSPWAVNFYTGCSNDCDYCYCKRGVMSHVWDNKPHLKKCFKDEDDALSVFKREIAKNQEVLWQSSILFSFTTDPMLPETIALTLGAMQIALDYDVPVKILTKRADWFPLLETPNFIKHKDKIAVGFTLTGRDDLEPGASPHIERIDTMRKCKDLGIHTFASIEPIVDLENSDRAISDALPYCDLFKVGLMSGGAKPDKSALADFVERWGRIFAKHGIKVYWKDSVRDYLGDDLVLDMDSSVESNYNIFK